MGYWAFELFQNDHDLDMLSDMAAEAKLPAILHAKDPAAVRTALDSGTLKRMLAKRRAPGFKSEYFLDMCIESNAEHEFCVLTAAAMTVGARIDGEDIQHLRDVYKRGKLLREGEAQMEVALEGYKNDGMPWVFELVLEPEASDDEDVGPGGFKLLNKFPLGSFMDNMRRNPEMQARMMEAVRGSGWMGLSPGAGATAGRGMPGSATTNVGGGGGSENTPPTATGASGAAKPTEKKTPVVNRAKAKKWLDSF